MRSVSRSPFANVIGRVRGRLTLMPGQPANAVCAGHRAACSGLRKSLTAALSLQRARIVRRRWLKVFRAFQPFRLANDSGALAGVETSSLRDSVWKLQRRSRNHSGGYSPHFMRRISPRFTARMARTFLNTCPVGMSGRSQCQPGASRFRSSLACCENLPGLDFLSLARFCNFHRMAGNCDRCGHFINCQSGSPATRLSRNCR